MLYNLFQWSDYIKINSGKIHIFFQEMRNEIVSANKDDETITSENPGRNK